MRVFKTQPTGNFKVIFEFGWLLGLESLALVNIRDKCNPH